MCYLPLPKEVRDRVNEHLMGMAYRGFGVTPEQAIKTVTGREVYPSCVSE